MAKKRININEATINRLIKKIIREMAGGNGQDPTEMIRPIADQVNKLQEQFQDTVNSFGNRDSKLQEIAGLFMDLNESLQDYVSMGSGETSDEFDDDDIILQ